MSRKKLVILLSFIMRIILDQRELKPTPVGVKFMIPTMSRLDQVAESLGMRITGTQARARE